MRLSRVIVDDFLAQKRIAVVGVSRDPRDFSRLLFAELLRRGYDAVPVNPNLDRVDGRRCFARVADITPPLDTALLLTPPNVTDEVVLDCAEAGILRIWMHRGAGRGSVSPRAVAFCREHSIWVVPGACPFMYLPAAGLVHRAHGFVSRLLPGRSVSA